MMEFESLLPVFIIMAMAIYNKHLGWRADLIERKEWRLNDKISNMKRHMSDLEEKIIQLERSNSAMSLQLETIENKLEGVVHVEPWISLESVSE